GDHRRVLRAEPGRGLAQGDLPGDQGFRERLTGRGFPKAVLVDEVEFFPAAALADEPVPRGAAVAAERPGHGAGAGQQAARHPGREVTWPKGLHGASPGRGPAAAPARTGSAGATGRDLELPSVASAPDPAPGARAAGSAGRVSPAPGAGPRPHAR